MGIKPRQHLAWLIVAGAAIVTGLHAAPVLRTASQANLTTIAWTFLTVRIAVEIVLATYAVAFLLVALTFVFMAESRRAAVVRRRRAPPVGIVYLCCDDVDRGALESVARLSYRGALHLVIHDDSRDERARLDVDAVASTLRRRRDWAVQVLRRPQKTGGKAGALNYVLAQTGHLYEHFLLCDNDSTVLDSSTIERALPYMDRADVVQFRTVAVDDPRACGANRRLAPSIDAFHAFVAPSARYGWTPFVGHNGLLRVSAVRQVGGFTAGFFSDDLDLTVRLNLAAFRVMYAPEIEMGEKHPPSYAAFRTRNYKWAYGCVQTLRAHAWSVLRCSRMSVAEKISFFQFTSFYTVQALLIFYICLVLLAAPLGALNGARPVWTSLPVGVALVVAGYAPLLAFALKSDREGRRTWSSTAAVCALVYGAGDFSVCRGVADSIRGRRRSWVPTNGVAAAIEPALFVEAAFGLALVAIPLACFPELLDAPCWTLAAAKFLFGPAVAVIYRDRPADLPTPIPDPEPATV